MPNRRSGLALALAAGCIGSAPRVVAQEPARPPAVVAIRAGRLVDVDRGEVRRDQVIIVRGDRIAAVQPGSAPLPAGAGVT